MAEECLENVKAVIEKMGVDLSARALDGAHRIGRHRTTVKHGDQHYDYTYYKLV